MLPIAERAVVDKLRDIRLLLFYLSVTFFLSDQDVEGFSFFELLSAKMFERFSGDIPYVKPAFLAVALESLEKRLRTAEK